MGSMPASSSWPRRPREWPDRRADRGRDRRRHRRRDRLGCSCSARWARADQPVLLVVRRDSDEGSKMDLALDDFDRVATDPDIHDLVAGFVRANKEMARAMDLGALQNVDGLSWLHNPVANQPGCGAARR